jgi:WD40-like Beta Propeller Repeat
VIEDSRSSLRRLSLGEKETDDKNDRRVASGDDKGNNDGRAFADAEPLFASTRSEIMPSIAPDGRQLFFVSDRDGEVRLWWVDQSRPDSMRSIDAFEPILRYPAVWNIEGNRALVLGEDARDEHDGENDARNPSARSRRASGRTAIYEVDPASGRATRLPVPDRVPVHAAYHPDPSRLLVVAEREQGRLGLVLYDRSRTPWAPLAEINDVVMALTDHANRRVVFVRTYKPGIWQADLDLGAAREIDRVGLGPRIRTVVAAADGAWFLDARQDCRWYWRRLVEPTTGEGRCLGNGPVMPQGLSYDSVRRKLYASIPDEAGLDIGVLPLRAFGIAGDALARRD